MSDASVPVSAPPVASRSRRSRRSPRHRSPVAKVVVLSVVTLVWLAPLIVVLFGALKSEADLFEPNGLVTPPTDPQFSNFADAWNEGNLARYMLNSTIITAIKVPLGVAVVCLGAYALSRLRWRFATPVFIVFLVGMVLPVQAALIPLQSLLSDLGLLNDYAALITIYIGFGVPFGMLIMRGYFLTIPRALDEAAMIDGAGAFQRFRHVVLPLAWPAIATLVIFDSLFTWNEFILAQLFITDDALRPTQAGLLAFSSQYQQQFGLLNAGILISIAPVLLVYLIFQRRFVSGLAGAVRG
jgi:raffinose/stachyose/melibiose transport system permease protein